MTINFSKISDSYEEKSLVQKSASKKLIDLLEITDIDNILDVGCATGNLTEILKRQTKGNVIGIDSSEGMISEACKKYLDMNIQFKVMSDVDISYKNEFDIIFCNSTFQWFKKPSISLSNFYNALRINGKIGVQAPAKENYCPNFIEALKYACKKKEISKYFSSFESPWFYLETAEDYKRLFEKQSFKILHHEIEEVHQEYFPEGMYDIFNSGAVAGYLNQNYFSLNLPDDFSKIFLNEIKDAFKEQANSEGKVELIFHRFYIIGKKESQLCRV